MPPRVGGKPCSVLGWKARATATMSLNLRIGHQSAPTLMVVCDLLGSASAHMHATILYTLRLEPSFIHALTTPMGACPSNSLDCKGQRDCSSTAPLLRPLCKLICGGCRFTRWILRACRLR